MIVETGSRPHLVERAMEALGGHRPPERRPQQASVALAEPPTAPTSPAPAAAPAPPRPIDLDALRRAGFVGAVAAMRTRATEELSIVQHQLLRAMQAAEPAQGRILRMVLVTSAKPGEGKSFCALNIAARLAVSSVERVVLVDADGKVKGSLSELLGHEEAPGLRDLAAAPDLRPNPLLVPSVFGRLSFLPCGTTPTEGAPLPSGEMLAAALSSLAATVPDRVLVVDAPPCLSASEPAALASIAGQVLMVVRAESTQRNEVEGALDMVDSCPTLQLLLNHMHFVESASFGAHGTYGG